MACFELIILKNPIERAFELKDGENSHEKKVKKQLLCWCFETLIVCPWLFVATLLKLQTVLYSFFFQILRFEIRGAAYLWMRLILGRLRYFISYGSICMKDQLCQYLPQLVQMESGLDDCGILNHIRRNTQFWTPVFASENFFTVTADKFQDNMTVNFSESQICKDAEITTSSFSVMC